MRVWVLLTSAQLLLFDGGSPQVASRRSALEVGMRHHRALSNFPSSTASCLHGLWLLMPRAGGSFILLTGQRNDTIWLLHVSLIMTFLRDDNPFY